MTATDPLFINTGVFFFLVVVLFSVLGFFAFLAHKNFVLGNKNVAIIGLFSLLGTSTLFFALSQNHTQTVCLLHVSPTTAGRILNASQYPFNRIKSKRFQSGFCQCQHHHLFRRFRHHRHHHQVFHTVQDRILMNLTLL